jgi:transcriptional regulator with XRE-family HTH domain
VRYGFGLPPFEEIRRKRARPSEILENPQTLGEHLKRARQLKRIRQKDAALILGIGHFTYMTWEKDQKTPFPRYYPHIIDWLGYDPLPIPKTEGQRLRHQRLCLGLTSNQMSERMGIDQGTLLTRENA